MRPTTLGNFGRIVLFTPAQVHTPRTEAEILEVLGANANSEIRITGSRHAWSDAVATEEVLLDMRHFDAVDFTAGTDGEFSLVSVGGGSPLATFLRRLRARGLTLPTIGTITRQTVAGAISTGTHGSGRPSLCHYVHAMRVAAYDVRGNPHVYEWNSPPDLEMARCSLGCAGVILSVTFRCVSLYQVSEHVSFHDSIESVLAAGGEHALDEFALVPYLWRYVGYHRGVANPHVAGWKWWKASLRRGAYRWYKLIVIDWFFHALLRTTLGLRAFGRFGRRLSDTITRQLFRTTRLLVQPGIWLTAGRGVVDESTHMLTRKHDLFKHVEMEVFVPEDRLAEVTELLRWIIDVFAGRTTMIPEAVRTGLASTALAADVMKHYGTYTHHYPLYFRRVLPDAAALSMTGAAAGPSYAIGLFCYRRQKRAYYALARFIATALMDLYGARLHWGKYLPRFPERPVTSLDFERLYLDLPRFRAWCNAVDPNGVFRSEYTHRVLGFDRVEHAQPVRTRKSRP